MVFISVLILGTLMPGTIGMMQKSNSDTNRVENQLGFMVEVSLYKLAKDGRFVYRVTNLGSEPDQTIENLTMNVTFTGGGVWYTLEDFHTTIFIQYLPIHESGLYPMEDQIFTKEQFPIFHRPFLGTFDETITCQESILKANVHLLFNYINEHFYYHYP